MKHKRLRKRRSPRPSRAFNTWPVGHVERKNPALLFLGNPDFYFSLGKSKRAQCDRMAREVLGAIFEKDRNVSLSKFENYLDTLALEMLFPSHIRDKWIGTVTVGRFKSEEGMKKFDQVFPDLKSKWNQVTSSEDIGKPCEP